MAAIRLAAVVVPLGLLDLVLKVVRLSLLEAAVGPLEATMLCASELLFLAGFHALQLPPSSRSVPADFPVPVLSDMGLFRGFLGMHGI